MSLLAGLERTAWKWARESHTACKAGSSEANCLSSLEKSFTAAGQSPFANVSITGWTQAHRVLCIECDTQEFKGDPHQVPTCALHILLFNLRIFLGSPGARTCDPSDCKQDGYKSVYKRYREVIPKQLGQ